jgi:Tfp pilus assembly protein PilN
MINLLPEDNKKEIRAGRANVLLLRYNIFTLVAIAMLILFCGLFWVIMSAEKINAEQTNRGNISKTAGYAAVRKEAEEYRNNLTIAEKILDKEINYTEKVFAITKLLPKGVVLDGITLSAKDFGSQTVLTAKAKDYASVTALKNSFQNSSVFSNVFFQAITDSSGSGTPAEYPISVNISVKINKVQP